MVLYYPIWVVFFCWGWCGRARLAAALLLAPINSPVNLPPYLTCRSSDTPLTLPFLLQVSPLTLPYLLRVSPLTLPCLLGVSPLTLPYLLRVSPLTVPYLLGVPPLTLPYLLGAYRALKDGCSKP